MGCVFICVFFSVLIGCWCRLVLFIAGTADELQSLPTCIWMRCKGPWRRSRLAADQKIEAEATAAFTLFTLSFSIFAPHSRVKGAREFPHLTRNVSRVARQGWLTYDIDFIILASTARRSALPAFYFHRPLTSGCWKCTVFAALNNQY